MESFGEMFNSVEERVEPEAANVTGSWPEWLKGSLVRVGPGKFDFGDFTLNHWLDGMAVLHRFHIDAGQVTFRSRYLRSDAYKKSCVAQRPVYTEFGTHCYPDPCKNIFSRMFSQFEMTDNASSSVLCVEDQMFVSSETCYLRRVDPTSLETKEKVDLNKLMSVNFASSHPLTDNTGTTYNLGCSCIGHPKYSVVKVPPSRETNLTAGCDPWVNARTLATVYSSWKTWYSYYHSFGMSENYIVFLEQPLLVNTLRLATSQIKSRSLSDCFEWHPQEKVKFIVIKKSTGEVIKTRYLSDDPFFVFHHVNTYETTSTTDTQEQEERVNREGGRGGKGGGGGGGRVGEREGGGGRGGGGVGGRYLVVDVVAYPSPTIIDKLYLNKVRMNEYSNEDPPQLKRFVLPLISDKELQSVREGEELINLPDITTASAMKTRSSNNSGSSSSSSSSQGPVSITVKGAAVGKSGWDMPAINSSHSARPYRYVYGTGGYEKGHFRNSVCKVNLITGESWKWQGNQYQYLAEPIFVPTPQQQQHQEDEDDGVVIVSVADVRKGAQDFLLLVDAKTMCELGRAGIDAPLPTSVHGLFLPDKL